MDNGDPCQGDECGYGQKEMDLEDVQEGESICWVCEGVWGKRRIKTDFWACRTEWTHTLREVHCGRSVKLLTKHPLADIRGQLDRAAGALQRVRVDD